MGLIHKNALNIEEHKYLTFEMATKYQDSNISWMSISLSSFSPCLNIR